MHVLTEEEEKIINAEKLPLYLNLSSCFIKLNQLTKAITNAEKVFNFFFKPNLQALDIDKNNIKAYWRLGQAFAETEDLELAKLNLIKAAKLNPQSKEIRDDLERVKEKMVASKEKEKEKPQIWKGIFSWILL